jgi:uncharacterized protein
MSAFRRNILGAVAMAIAAMGATIPGDAQTPEPTRTAVPPHPVCARPNVAARVVRPVEPDIPALAQQQGIEGTVQVVVSLDENSRVTSASIQTSPSAVLNQAALAAARASSFQAEIRDCRPIAAKYLYTVEFPPTARRGYTASSEPTIEVSAQGLVRRAPDVAYVSAGIVTNDDDTAVAASRNDAVFAAVTAKLHALGINDADIRATTSSALVARPNPAPSAAPSGSQPGRYGYFWSRQIVITVVRVASAPQVSDAVAAAGAASVQLRYDLLDREPAYREALAAAVKDARARAQAAASAGGVQLGKVYRLVSTGGDTPSPFTYAGAVFPFGGGAVRSVSGSAPIDVRAGVTIIYLIKQ